MKYLGPIMAWKGAHWAAWMMLLSTPVMAADVPDLYGQMLMRSAARSAAAGTLDGVFAALMLPEGRESAERIAYFLIQADGLIEAFNRDYELGVIQQRAYLSTRGRYSVVPNFTASLGMNDARELLLAQLKALQDQVFGNLARPGRPVGERAPADVYFEFALSQINFKLKVEPVFMEDFIQGQRGTYEALLEIAESEPTSVREFTHAVCIRSLQ